MPYQPQPGTPPAPRPDRPRMPEDYGIAGSPPDLTTYPWHRATEQLVSARNFWLCTTRPDGRPHAMPVWALWLDDACYFSTSPHSRNGLNLQANPHVVLHLESGDDVVILEGAAEKVRDPALLARFADIYDAKYQFRIDPSSPGQAVYVLRPKTAFTWQQREFAESATRWRFDAATPPWHVHLRSGSSLPTDPDECRRYLRSGNLPETLLTGGDNFALREGEITLTHDELRLRAERVAAGLATLGVGAGSRVCLYAANSLHWVLAYLGTQRLGAICNPCNPAYLSAELEHILADSRPTLVLTDAERMPLVQNLRGRFPSVAHVVAIEALPEGHTVPPLPALGPESPAVIIYTSGTTGRPKGALLDHGNLLAQARGVIHAWRWQPSDRLVLALPLFHVHGLAIGLHGTLARGAGAVLLRFSPEAVVRELQNGGTMFFGVPAMYQRLVEYLETQPADLSGIRLFVCGSAPLPPALFERCLAVLGQPVLERYGITEGGIVVSNPYDGPRQAGRVGYPLPGVEVRLGEQDEVLLKGGQVFSGYLDNPAASREALTDGWLHTGDVGEFGPDGSLAIRGRLKELIISGGFNVYPREVEMVLEAHPAVVEAAVAGVPSERWGEEVTAYVVARSPVAADELIAHARERLAPYKCPRQVHFLEALPRNAMGKVQRSALPTAQP